MILEINHLHFSYESQKPLLQDVSFQVGEGQVLCILGPNGVGKTTLLNCMAGIEKPKSGTILVEGRSIQEMPVREVAKAVGFVPQFILPTFAYEVLEYVVTGCAPRIGTFEKPKPEHYAEGEQALEKMKISHLKHKYYTQISGGERQQVSIARALAQRSKVILMDEPTAHLDYGNQIKVLKLIKELAKDGFAVVLTTHNPDHALLLEGQVVALLPQGEYCQGHCRQVVNSEFLKKLYGAELKLCHIEELGRTACVSPAI